MSDTINVKPLVWEEARPGEYRAKTIVGRYLIGRFGRQSQYELLTPDQGDQDDQAGDFGKIEDAKSAAQADYEQRILSAIDTSAITASQEEVKRLREALLKSTVAHLRNLLDWLDEHEENATLLVASLTEQQLEAARNALKGEGK